MTAAVAAAVTEYCTFEVGDLFLGIDVSFVQEVLRYQEITPVPLVAPEVRGLINLRGQIVTAVDLGRRLGVGKGRAALPLNVVVRVGERNVSLLVDSIGDVVTTDRAPDPAPQTAAAQVLDAISGVVQLQSRLMLVLDVTRVTGPMR